MFSVITAVIALAASIGGGIISAILTRNKVLAVFIGLFIMAPIFVFFSESVETFDVILSFLIISLSTIVFGDFVEKHRLFRK